jgi:transcriptional regulator with XRE-family HTH domain
MRKVNIGRKIKQYRTDQSLTQQQLADRIGVSCEMISRYERGIHEPFNKINDIAEALNIPLENLLRQKEENKNEYSYTIPLFTKIPSDFDFSNQNTTFYYSCSRWIYEIDREVFAIDANLVNEKNVIYYISTKVFPYKKHTVLVIRDNSLFIENFKNQKQLLGVVLAKEIKLA